MRYTPKTGADGDYPWVAAYLPAATSVTCAVYRLNDGTTYSLASSAAVQIGTTGVWRFDLDNVTADLTTEAFASIGVLFTPDSGTPVLEQLAINGVQEATGDSAVTASLNTLYQGAIWIDTVNGSNGTVLGVNGTQANPVRLITDAASLAAALGVRKYVILHGTLTVNTAHENWTFEGRGSYQTGNWSAVSFSLALVPAGISGSVFNNLSISGECSSTPQSASFENCVITTLTISGELTFKDCFFDVWLTVPVGSSSKSCIWNFLGCKFSFNGPSTVFHINANAVLPYMTLDRCHGEIELRSTGGTGSFGTVYISGGRGTVIARGSTDLSEWVFETTDDWTFDLEPTVVEPGFFTRDYRNRFRIPVLSAVAGPPMTINIPTDRTILTEMSGLLEAPYDTWPDAIGQRIVLSRRTGTPRTEERVIKAARVVTVDKTVILGAYLDQIQIELETPFSSVPANGDLLTFRNSPDEWAFENVLEDNQNYSGNTLLSSRWTKFANATDAAAATPGDPSHANAIRTINVEHSESVPGKRNKFRGTKA